MPEKHNNFTIALSTRKEIGKGVPLSNYGNSWAGGGNGYEEVNGGISMVISMATRELRIKKMEGREQKP